MRKIKKIAIIVWKWKSLEKQELTSKHLSTYHKDDLEGWLKKHSEEFQVVRRRRNNNPPKQTQHKVVCIRVASGHAEVSLAFLKDVAQHYKKDNDQAELFYFLHRTDGFSAKCIATLYQQKAINKCFLFNDGQDFIYYPSQKMGLLDDIGHFYYGEPKQDQPEVNVADEKNKWVYNRYFYPTWNYYCHEYYLKTIELREDLLDFFLEKIDQLDTKVSLYYLREVLNANRDLQLRVKSLLDHENLDEKETGTLRYLERRAQKSYTFDDLKAFVQNKPELEKAHHELTEMIRVFYSAKSDITTEKIVPRQQFQYWQTHFIHLANQLHQVATNF